MPEKAGQYGHVQPLRDAYRQCMDYAFQQVFTGATDYNTAIRQATRNLADMGVRVIDYESGVHTSLEAAVRRNIMGGLGLMQEQISQQNHDEMGANGWEINAHAACAPDHEPIQGRQYSDEAFKRLNGSLKRRIGTLNCGHKEFPIILGVSEPQYSPAELEAMRQQNAKGVTIEGRHYSLYEATQMQRKMERSIRKQKKRILVDKATGDEEKLRIDQTKLRMQNTNYKKFSDAAGLRTQRERAQVAGFGRKEAAAASRVPSGSTKPTADVSTVPNVSKNTVENKPQLIQGFMAGGNGDAGKAPVSQLFSRNTVPTADPQKISSAALDNSNKTMYNTPPENELLERYTQDVKDGWISPLSGFDNYKQLYQQIESGIVGKTTSNGILITGQSRHFMQRVIGTMADPKKLADDLQIVHRSGTEISDIMDALFSPERIDPPVIRENGRRSIRFIGSRGIVTVNPDTGQLIQTNQRKR